MSLNQYYWLEIDNSPENKISITANLFREGTEDFLGVFYTYTIYNTYSENNKDNMGALGIRVIFKKITCDFIIYIYIRFFLIFYN